MRSFYEKIAKAASAESTYPLPPKPQKFAKWYSEKKSLPLLRCFSADAVAERPIGGSG